MSKEHWSIEKAQEVDIEGIAQLEKEIFSLPWSKEGLLESFQNPSYVFLVAKEKTTTRMESEKICAYVGMYEVVGEGFITNVCVHPSYRKKGIATQLINVLGEIAAQKGLEVISLEVRVSNEPAIHMYKKIGFCEGGIRKKFYEKPSEDALMMWWKL